MCGAAAPSWGAGALEVSMSVLLGEGGEGVSLSYGEGGDGGTGERGAQPAIGSPSTSTVPLKCSVSPAAAPP